MSILKDVSRAEATKYLACNTCGRSPEYEGPQKGEACRWSGCTGRLLLYREKEFLPDDPRREMAYWEQYIYETSVQERDYGHLVGICLKQNDVRQAVWLTRVCAEQLHAKLGALLKHKPAGT